MVKLMKIIFLLIILNINKMSYSQDIDFLISQAESDIISLRDEVEESYKTRCTEKTTCSYLGCALDLPFKDSCNKEFKLTECNKCYNPSGVSLLMDQYAVKLADKYPPRVSQHDIRVKEVVKGGKNINSLLQKLNKKNP